MFTSERVEPGLLLAVVSVIRLANGLEVVDIVMDDLGM